MPAGRGRVARAAARDARAPRPRALRRRPRRRAARGVRVARADVDDRPAARQPSRLRQGAPRARPSSSRSSRTPARPATRRGRGRARPRTSRSSSRTCGATSSCAGATSRASPRSSGPTTRCSTTTSRGCAPPRPRTSSRRLRDGLVPLVEEAAPSTADDALVAGGPFPIDAQRRLIATILRQVGVDDAALAPGRRDPPVRGDASRPATCGSRPATPRTTSTRSSAPCTSSATACTRRTSTPRSRARRSAPACRARSTSRRAGCGRTWSAAARASGAGASRTCRARSPSASAGARGRTSTAR